MEHLIAWAGLLGAWELPYVQEWESSFFWVLLVLMLLLTLGLTAYRMRRSADLAQRVE